MASFETTLTVPTAHVRELMDRLARAGFILMDTGARVTTEDGVASEATLRLLHVTIEDVAAEVELGVSIGGGRR